jgi:hypothetical protein
MQTLKPLNGRAVAAMLAGVSSLIDLGVLDTMRNPEKGLGG